MDFRNKEVIFTSLLLFLFCMSGEFTYANSFETTEHLQDVTKTFLQKNIAVEPEETLEITVNPSIAKLQLPTCSRDIEAAFPMNTNKDQATGVELVCYGTPAWHVLASVDIKINTPVLVAKQTIMPKETITDDELEYAMYDKNHLYNSYFKNKQEVIGQIASHLITPGMVLTKKNLQQPVLVHRNEVISLTARSHSIAVTMQGIAKSDGSLNSTIKVYNPTSKRVVDAVVVGTNKAEIIA